jgi:hypothetical protein
LLIRDKKWAQEKIPLPVEGEGSIGCLFIHEKHYDIDQEMENGYALSFDPFGYADFCTFGVGPGLPGG